MAGPVLARIFFLNDDQLDPRCANGKKGCTPDQANQHRLGQAQLEWIRAHKSGAAVIFFAQHEPAYGTCAHDPGDDPGKDLVGTDGTPYTHVLTMDWWYEDRNAYIEEIAPYAAMLFSAHEHQYSRRRIDDTLYQKVGKSDETTPNSDIVGAFYEVKPATAGAPVYARIDDRCSANLVSSSTAQDTYYYTVVEVDYSGIDPASGRDPASGDTAPAVPPVYAHTVAVPYADGQVGTPVRIDPEGQAARFSQRAIEDRLIALGQSWQYWAKRDPGNPGEFLGACLGAPVVDSDGRSWTDPDFDPDAAVTSDCAWTEGPTRMGYPSAENGLSVPTDLSNLQGNASAAYIRKGFSFDPAQRRPMTLLMDHDDGFQAFINGDLVVDGNCCTTRAGQTVALELHEAGVVERFPLDSKDLYGEGKALSKGSGGNHVLAIVGYNYHKDSSDLILGPELRVTRIGLVAAPTISPAGGVFAAPVEVSLETATAEASIHYTLDSSDPADLANPGREAYGGVFVLSQTTTVKAIAVKAGLEDSDVASAEFTIGAVAPVRVKLEGYEPGGEGVAYHDTTAGNRGDAECGTDDVDLWNGETEGCYIGATATGEWVKYMVEVPADGDYTVSIRYATPKDARKVHLEFDDVDLTGTVVLPNTGGWQNWQTYTLPNPVTLSAGTQVMRLFVEQGGMNLNWIELALQP